MHQKSLSSAFVKGRFGMSLCHLLKISAFTCLLPLVSHTQNLVPNGSFEDFNQCPTFLDNLSDCSSWSNFGGTCDYYNACAPSEGLGIPQNVFGFQHSLSGDGYIALVGLELESDYREYAGAELITPLIIGTKYYCSFYVARSYKEGTSIGLASNNIGLKFTTAEYNTQTSLIANNQPTIFNSAILSDTTYWHQIKGEFIADSAYRFVVLGNFFDNAHTNFEQEFLFERTSYYYIEDLRVSTDSAYAWEPLRVSELKTSDFKIFNSILYNDLIIQNPLRETGKIFIYDSLGKSILITQIESDQKSISLNLNHIPHGVYFAVFSNENTGTQKSFKIMKQ